MRVFERPSERSHCLRFNGPKPCLRAAELRELASVDAFRHVLVAHVEGDEHAVGIAQFVREGERAEVAFEIADDLPAARDRTALVAALIDQARGVGVTRDRNHRNRPNLLYGKKHVRLEQGPLVPGGNRCQPTTGEDNSGPPHTVRATRRIHLWAATGTRPQGDEGRHR